MNRKYLLGTIIIILGGLLLLNQITDFSFWNLLGNWWPIILVAIGVSVVISNKGNHLGGIIIAIIFGAILLGNLDLIGNNYWRFTWPLIIIAVGLWFIFGRGGNFGKNNENSDDYISAIAIFSGSENRVISQNFKGASLTSLFGGVDLDLRGANTQLTEVSIDAFAAFGGINIKVPVNWKVIISGIPLFGGWSNKTKVSISENSPILRIKGTVAFGGLEITN